MEGTVEVAMGDITLIMVRVRAQLTTGLISLMPTCTKTAHIHMRICNEEFSNLLCKVDHIIMNITTIILHIQTMADRAKTTGCNSCESKSD